MLELNKLMFECFQMAGIQLLLYMILPYAARSLFTLGTLQLVFQPRISSISHVQVPPYWSRLKIFVRQKAGRS
jgi:hypothetical protein